MGFFDKIKAGLTKTREALSNTLGNVFTASEIDDDFFDELEESLILADLGMDTAIRAVSQLRQRIRNDSLKTTEEAREALYVFTKYLRENVFKRPKYREGLSWWSSG